MRLADAKREGHTEDIENIKKEWGDDLEDEETNGEGDSEEGEEESEIEEDQEVEVEVSEQEAPGAMVEEGDFEDEATDDETPTDRQMRIREQDAQERDEHDTT